MINKENLFTRMDRLVVCLLFFLGFGLMAWSIYGYVEYHDKIFILNFIFIFIFAISIATTKRKGMTMLFFLRKKKTKKSNDKIPYLLSVIYLIGMVPIVVIAALLVNKEKYLYSCLMIIPFSILTLWYNIKESLWRLKHGMVEYEED